MTRDEGKFLSRWSRLKQEAREKPVQDDPAPPRELSPADPQAPPPELPPVESLNADSDFRPFFHPSVDEDLRRGALKKLFADPRFNVIDVMDIDIDDYSKLEPLAPAVAATMKQAQRIMDWAREAEEERKQAEANAAAGSKEGGSLSNERLQTRPADPEDPGDQQADASEPADRSRT
jgi:hypothetical protein